MCVCVRVCVCVCCSLANVGLLSMGSYVDSQWGVAQFSLPNESPCVCAFVGDRKSVIGEWAVFGVPFDLENHHNNLFYFDTKRRNVEWGGGGGGVTIRASTILIWSQLKEIYRLRFLNKKKGCLG